MLIKQSHRIEYKVIAGCALLR